MECDQRVRIDHIDHIPLIDHIMIGRECMAGLGKAQSGVFSLPSNLGWAVSLFPNPCILRGIWSNTSNLGFL